MDIASLSMALSQNKVMTDVNVSLLSKSLDMTETLTTNLAEMIDAVPSSPAGVGANIDISL